VSNNFAIKFNGADKAFVYQMDCGAAMAKGFQKNQAYRRAKNDID